MSDVLTARQVAVLIHRSYPRTVELLGGEIPASKPAGRWLVLRSDVDAWIERSRTTRKVTPRRGRGRRSP